MTPCIRQKEEIIKKEEERKIHEDDTVVRNYGGLGEQTNTHYCGAGKFWAVTVLLLPVVTLLMCLLALLGQKEHEQKEVVRDGTYLTELAYINKHQSTIALQAAEDDLSQIVSQNSEVEDFYLDEQCTEESSAPGIIPDILMDNNDSEDLIKCDMDRRDCYRVLENHNYRIEEQQHTGSTREQLVRIYADSHKNFDEDRLENLSDNPFLIHPVEIRPALLQLLYV
ncbi:uncharacterized protein [Panulirus ornatus]|uniref:uncharacterized protein n=1 Tax=Panulirus ornatus TaxID=150431 RepID=UPI003A83E072